MKTEQEIREELQMHEMSDILYAVVSENNYVRYIGTNRDKAIDLATTWNDNLIAISDVVLASWLTLDKEGLCLYLRKSQY